MDLPSRADFVVVGAGVHGLSTAWHLAEEQARSGRTPSVVVVDKTGIAAGASGIACGVVRNNYFQPAMTELMCANIEVWEQDPQQFHYQSVGYMALGAKSQVEDLVAVHARQQQVGYPSDIIVGESEVSSYMRRLFPDWRAEGVQVCLHEHRGGFAHNVESIRGLAVKAREAGAKIVVGPEVEGFSFRPDQSVSAVVTDQGVIEADQVVVAVGPWIKNLWHLLQLPTSIDIRAANGEMRRGVPMWTYWYLQEGAIGTGPTLLTTADGHMAPVLHVDSDAPLIDDAGSVLSAEGLWGIYFKQDLDGVQGGGTPIPKGVDFEVDPYPSSTVEDGFADMWCAALSHCMSRFQGLRTNYRNGRSGGVGAFSADSFPVFDYMHPNVYVIADSNHGYKMIGVGREVAQVMTGGESRLLLPFRYARFAEGALHPESHSPYPWS